MNKSSLRCSDCKAGIMCNCMEKKEKENVDHPDHYLKNTGHEVIDVINAWKLNFELGNAVKYIARAGKKNKEKTEEDLRKALWFINFEIDELKEK